MRLNKTPQWINNTLPISRSTETGRNLRNPFSRLIRWRLLMLTWVALLSGLSPNVWQAEPNQPMGIWEIWDTSTKSDPSVFEALISGLTPDVWQAEVLESSNTLTESNPSVWVENIETKDAVRTFLAYPLPIDSKVVDLDAYLKSLSLIKLKLERQTLVWNPFEEELKLLDQKKQIIELKSSVIEALSVKVDKTLNEVWIKQHLIYLNEIAAAINSLDLKWSYFTKDLEDLGNRIQSVKAKLKNIEFITDVSSGTDWESIKNTVTNWSKDTWETSIAWSKDTWEKIDTKKVAWVFWAWVFVLWLIINQIPWVNLWNFLLRFRRRKKSLETTDQEIGSGWDQSEVVGQEIGSGWKEFNSTNKNAWKTFENVPDTLKKYSLWEAVSITIPPKGFDGITLMGKKSEDSLFGKEISWTFNWKLDSVNEEHVYFALEDWLYLIVPLSNIINVNIVSESELKERVDRKRKVAEKKKMKKDHLEWKWSNSSSDNQKAPYDKPKHVAVSLKEGGNTNLLKTIEVPVSSKDNDNTPAINVPDEVINDDKDTTPAIKVPAEVANEDKDATLTTRVPAKFASEMAYAEQWIRNMISNLEMLKRIKVTLPSDWSVNWYICTTFEDYWYNDEPKSLSQNVNTWYYYWDFVGIHNGHIRISFSNDEYLVIPIEDVYSWAVKVGLWED